MGFSINNKIGKKYDIDDNAFKDINSEIKAYCLGFLYADGCLGKYGGDYSVRINIHKKDALVLDMFKQCIKTNKNWKEDSRGYVILNISNKQIFQDLQTKGVDQAKTWKIRFPSNFIVPKELKRHFVRGYFDGDGSVCRKISNNGARASFSITSNLFFSEALQNYLINEVGFTRTKILQQESKDKKNMLGTIRYSGGKNVEKFYHLLYDDSSYFLPRKKIKFEQFLYAREMRSKEDRYNKKYKIVLRNTITNEVVECSFGKNFLSTFPLSKKSIYDLYKGKRQIVKGWELNEKQK
jgi:intein/homing endonuclease